MEEQKKQVVPSDNEEPIKTTKKKDRSIWKKAGEAALSIGALAVIIIKKINETK